MKKIYIFICCIIFITACASMETISPPQENSYFVLDSDYLRKTQRGVSKTTFIEGLRRGTYTLVGEDRNGKYYKGENDCVVVMLGDMIEKYEANGVIAPFEERYSSHYTKEMATGGLWIPKDSESDDAKLFFVLHTRPDDQGIAGLLDGTISFIPFTGEQHFISKINFKNEELQ